MDAVRIIDLWQVILQEPRVAAKEAALIMQGEIEQHMVREKGEKQHRLNSKTVQKTWNAKKQQVVAASKDGRRKKNAMRMMKREKMMKQRAYAKGDENLRDEEHIDLLA